MISTFCKGKRHIKKIILITNATGPLDSNDLGPIVERLKSLEIELIVLCVSQLAPTLVPLADFFQWC